MDAKDQVNKFKEFFELNYYDDILSAASKSEDFIVVDFSRLSMFDLDLAQEFLENPDDALKAAEYAISRFDLGVENAKINIRFKGLPESSFLLIRDIRSKHLKKIFEFKGIVRQKSDVRPQVTSAKFECPSCGNIIPILQLDQKFKEPGSCNVCGRKGKFNLLSKELVDAQKITLEEDTEDLDGAEQPKRLSVFLQNDLVSPMSDKRTNPGSKIIVVGIIKEVPITLQSGGKSTRYDLMLEANYVEPVQEEFSSLNITPETKEKILSLSKDAHVYEKLVTSIAPTIYGHDKIKEALVLQMFGGVHKDQEAGTKKRGDIHILLIGDPGSGKSVLLQRMAKVAPKARFVSGKGASGAGLTAAVIKDDFIRGWALEAGALVLSNRGMVCIDELDKMSAEDTSAMHEALEQQSVSISKANIQATLRCETTVLAAANPKFGRFDPYGVLAKQIDLPPALINRFDLIFPVKDLPDKIKDEQLASFILKLHQEDSSAKNIPLDAEMIKYYVAYAKQNIKPKLTEPALREIKDYFVSMRNSGGSEEKIPSIPISARQLEGLVRLAEASAKTRLSKTVTKKDARRAIDLLHYCLTLIGLDAETGKFDIDRIATGITASQRGSIHTIKEIITELEKALSSKVIPMDDLVREAEIKGISESKTEEIVEGLKRKGDLFSPKVGLISRM